MYKDCINKQKELEREESDGDNANQQYNQVSSLFSLYCISTTLNKPKHRYNFSPETTIFT